MEKEMFFSVIENENVFYFIFLLYKHKVCEKAEAEKS